MTPGEFFAAVMARSGGDEFAIVTPTLDILAPLRSQNETAFANISIEIGSAVLAPMIGQLGFQRAQRGELADALTLDANYVRRTDAEMHWKES